MDIKNALQILYEDRADSTYETICDMIKKHRQSRKERTLSERDTMLITYGDSLVSTDEKPLETLTTFLKTHVGSALSAVHLLPMFPYSSDDGFSVIDFEAINPRLGTWQHIKALGESYDLMFDAVINHISASSRWFKAYQKGDENYADFFVEYDANFDYSQVVRPRATPLFHTFDTVDGPKKLWTTFSEDQLDLNYKNPRVLVEILEILIMYALRGARFIRLDAIGFLWKESGTPCIHHANAHRIIQVIRYVLDQTIPGTILISETNVPHHENVSYFGVNQDEAHMVYQFPLPPLVLHTYFRETPGALRAWAVSLENTPLKEGNTYFNFLASHDGIGMRPTEALISSSDRDALVDHVKALGGKVSYKKNNDGSTSVYELNINYFDALRKPNEPLKTTIKKFIGAHALLLGMRGIPGIYIHSLLGSLSDYEGAKKSEIPRRINREKLDIDTLTTALNDANTRRAHIFKSLLNMIAIRHDVDAFHPSASQTVLTTDRNVFMLERRGKTSRVAVMINVSSHAVTLASPFIGHDLFSKQPIKHTVHLEAFDYIWLYNDYGGNLS